MINNLRQPVKTQIFMPLFFLMIFCLVVLSFSSSTKTNNPVQCHESQNFYKANKQDEFLDALLHCIKTEHLSDQSYYDLGRLLLSSVSITSGSEHAIEVFGKIKQIIESTATPAVKRFFLNQLVSKAERIALKSIPYPKGSKGLSPKGTSRIWTKDGKYLYTNAIYAPFVLDNQRHYMLVDTGAATSYFDVSKFKEHQLILTDMTSIGIAKISEPVKGGLSTKC